MKTISLRFGVIASLCLVLSNYSIAGVDPIPENARQQKGQGSFEFGTLLASPSKATFFTFGGKGINLFQNNFYIGGGGHGGFGSGGDLKSAGLGYGGFITGYLHKMTENFQISPEILWGGGGMGGSYLNGDGSLGGGSIVFLPRVNVLFRMCQGMYFGLDAGYLISPMFTKMSGVALGLNFSIRRSVVTWLVD